MKRKNNKLKEFTNKDELIKIIDEYAYKSEGDKLAKLLGKIDKSLIIPLYEVYSNAVLTSESAFVIFNSMLTGIQDNQEINGDEVFEFTKIFLKHKDPIVRSLTMPNFLSLLEECYGLDGNCLDNVLAKNILSTLKEFIENEPEEWLRESTKLIYEQYKK